MSNSTASVGGSLGRPLYQRKVIANPATVPSDDAPKRSAPQPSTAALTPAAHVTIQAATTPNRTQALTQQLDDDLTSSLTRIRQKVGSGSSGAGRVLDVSA